jgi:hypothetical protein
MNAYFSTMEDDRNKRTSKSSEEKFYDFIGAAAHDLQAPLRKLSIFVERAFTKNENNFDENAKEYIARIESCIAEMKSLINGLLVLAEADAVINGNEHCDLGVIAQQAVANMDEEVSSKGLVIHVDPLPAVRGNPVQYRQLFKNLIENAVKFSKNDMDSRIEITSRKVTDEERKLFDLKNKDYHRIEISDNGIGFSGENYERIFEPFVRLNPKSEYAGNGLGLFICKKIVANHNGIIYAEANDEQGARFVLFLPETP